MKPVLDRLVENSSRTGFLVAPTRPQNPAQKNLPVRASCSPAIAGVLLDTRIERCQQTSRKSLGGNDMSKTESKRKKKKNFLLPVVESVECPSLWWSTSELQVPMRGSRTEWWLKRQKKGEKRRKKETEIVRSCSHKCSSTDGHLGEQGKRKKRRTGDQNIQKT